MTAFPTRKQQAVIVQTATDLPATDDGWFTQGSLRLERASEGAGQIIGQASFQQTFGIVSFQGDPSGILYTVGTAPQYSGGIDDGLIGDLVRLLVEDGGSVIINGIGYTPFWWGVIEGFNVNPDGRPTTNAGGEATWTAAGIIACLDQIVINDGWVIPAPSDTDQDYFQPGFMPPFNKLPGGDRSAAKVTINGGDSYIHDFSTSSDTSAAHKWQAIDIVTLLLNGSANPNITSGGSVVAAGWNWQIADPDGCLNWAPERLDFDGMTVLQALNRVINLRRGLTYNVKVSGTTVTLTCHSGTDIPIDIPASDTYAGCTVPASTYTVDLFAAGDPFIRGLSMSEDNSGEYDIIEVRGNKPWVGITLYYTGFDDSSLIQGWNDNDETAWDEDPLTPGTDAVWRRFIINPQWLGTQYNDSTKKIGLRNLLDADSGDGHLTGLRLHDETADNPPVQMLATERMLPISAAVGTTDGELTYRLTPYQPPVVCAGSGSGWTDYSQQWMIEVQDWPAAFLIDDGQQGTLLQSAVANESATMTLTVGFREIQPLRVSYVFDQQTWARSLPRIKVIDLTDVEQQLLLSGSIIGTVDLAPAALAHVATDQVLRDDTDVLLQILALAVVRFGFPVWTVSWTSQAILDISDETRAGRLLESVTVGTGSTNIGEVISRRTWTRVVHDGVDCWDTSYETTRVKADVDAIL